MTEPFRFRVLARVTPELAKTGESGNSLPCGLKALICGRASSLHGDGPALVRTRPTVIVAVALLEALDNAVRMSALEHPVATALVVLGPGTDGEVVPHAARLIATKRATNNRLMCPTVEQERRYSVYNRELDQLSLVG